MSDSLVRLSAPGLIGYTVSVFMYGATLGQSICYTVWFPNDPWPIKAFVFMVVLADTVQLIGSTLYIWELLGVCHGNSSWICTHEMPLGAYVIVSMTFMSFVVQSFYCRRIWIISDKNKPLTLIICIIATSGLVFATCYSVAATRVGTLDYMFSSPLITGYAGSSTLCDFLITFAIFKYMWKSGIRNQRTIIQDLALVCINTGAFTCAIAVITGIVYFVHMGSGYLVAGVGMVFTRSYVNSMLAVLNARKKIRERDEIYELGSFPALSSSSQSPSGSSHSHCT